MHRILVVVFQDEASASEGRRALLQLDPEGSIKVNADAVLAKRADGSATVVEEEAWPRAALISTALGSLIGMLGGPIGVVAGAAAGFAGGGIADLNNVRIGEDFVADVGKTLLPHKAAVVAEIEEDDPTPVDTRMRAIGGTVFRHTLLDVVDTVRKERISGVKADLARLREQHVKPPPDRKV